MQKTKEMRVRSWVRRILGTRKWQTTPASCLENLMNRGAWHIQFMGLQIVRHDWSNLAHTFIRKKKNPKTLSDIMEMEDARPLSYQSAFCLIKALPLPHLTFAATDLWVNHPHFIKDESETQRKWATCPNLDWKPKPSDSCPRAPGAHRAMWPSPRIWLLRLLTGNSTP